MIQDVSFERVATITDTNSTANLTLNIVLEEISSQPAINGPIWSQVIDVGFPIVTLLIGAGITYYFTIRDERKQVRRYEYSLIIDMLDILKKDKPLDAMVDLYNEEKRKPEFRKMDDYEVIRKFMADIIDNKNPDRNELEILRDHLAKMI